MAVMRASLQRRPRITCVAFMRWRCIQPCVAQRAKFLVPVSFSGSEKKRERSADSNRRTDDQQAPGAILEIIRVYRFKVEVHAGYLTRALLEACTIRICDLSQPHQRSVERTCVGTFHVVYELQNNIHFITIR